MRTRMNRTSAALLPLLVATAGCAATADPERAGAPAMIASESPLATAPTPAPAFAGAAPLVAPRADDEMPPPPRLTGDWGGVRTSLEDQGFRLDGNVWAIGQSVLGESGFRSADEIQVGGEILTTFDSEKMGLYPGGSLRVRVEGRAGDSVVGAAGSIAPVNTRAVIPPARVDQDILAVTEVRYDQVVEEHLTVFGGLVQTLDLLDQNPLASGRGLEHFMNIALVQSPVLFRSVPYSSLGVGLEGRPTEQIGVKVLLTNQEESANRNPFDADTGTTVATEIAVDYDFSGLPGGDLFGFVWSDSDFPPLGDDPRLIFPPGSAPQNNEDTWAIYYNFFQYISVLEEGPDPTGWGIFGRFNLADRAVNPVQWMASFGLSGDGFLSMRPNDRVGFGYYYLGLADEAQVNALFLADEQGFEVFYDVAVLPYLHITPDLQWIDVGLDGATNSWIAALRVNVVL